MVAHIDSFDKYQEIINSPKPVVIDFTATWCGPCRAIAPAFEETSKNNTDVDFYKVDIDQQSAIANAVGIKSVPTFILFKGGERIRDFSGASRQELEGLVNAAKGLV